MLCGAFASQTIHKIMKLPTPPPILVPAVGQFNRCLASNTCRYSMKRRVLVEGLFILMCARLQIKDYLFNLSRKGIGCEIFVGKIDYETVVTADIHACIGSSKHRDGVLNPPFADLFVVCP